MRSKSASCRGRRADGDRPIPVGPLAGQHHDQRHGRHGHQAPTGPVLHVTFKGGESEYTVGPDVPVLATAPGRYEPGEAGRRGLRHRTASIPTAAYLGSHLRREGRGQAADVVPPIRRRSARSRRYRNCAAAGSRRRSRYSRGQRARQNERHASARPARHASAADARRARTGRARRAPRRSPCRASPSTTKSASRSNGSSNARRRLAASSTAATPGSAALAAIIAARSARVSGDRPARTSRARRDGARTGR